MKKLRIVLTLAVFAGAVVGAFASKDDYPNHGIFGIHPMGYCVEAEEFEQEGCGTGGMQYCTVFLEDIGGSAIACRIQVSEYECAGVWRTWQ